MRLRSQALLGIGWLMLAAPGFAGDFDLGDGITGNFKNRISAGMSFRADQPDSRLIYKDNLNPGLCGTGVHTACYSFNNDSSLNAKLVAAPGAYGAANKDDGDLNYKQGDITAAVAKLVSELSVSWNEWTFKGGVIAFLDPYNTYFDENHPDTTYQPRHPSRPNTVRDSTGHDLIIKDLLVTGKFQVLDHDFLTTVGYQHIHWGESTLIALNSINEINAPDERLLYQTGTQISEVFRPTPAVLLATPIIPNVNLDLVYIFKWDGVALPGGGSLYSPLDSIGKNNLLYSLGQFHEDPNGIQRLPEPGNEISNTSLNAGFLGHGGHPSNQGQFGGKLTVYAPDFNGGTEFSFYALNYHSRLPIASGIAGNHTCVKDSTVDFLQAIVDCQGTQAVAGGLDPTPLDTAKIFFDYPEDIHMFGTSFNTNVGKFSLAGELSYRPNLPVQIDVPDVVFATLQPTLPANDIHLGVGALGQIQLSSLINAGLDPGVAAATLTSPRTLSLLTTVLTNPATDFLIPSRTHAVPDYLEHYRHYNGIQPGQIIPGYQRLQVLQFDLTAIRAFGSSENPIGADQILIITEGGFTDVLNMPKRSRLQFEGGDLNDTHASPGADGSGGLPTDGGYVASRVNPHQQVAGFASPIAAGYRIIARLEYDNVFWGWNLKPQIIWSQDVYGIAISPSQNFIEGTKTYQINTEIETGTEWTGNIFYQGSTGGGTVNANRDKDFAGFAINYTF